MSRLLRLLLPAALLTLTAPVALAHGGRFVLPGGGVPPGLREPSDPTPPPPPPPPTGWPSPTPSDPAPSGPGPLTPPERGPSPTPPPPKTNPDENKAGGRKAPTSYDQWIFWWSQNNDDILRLKEAIYRLRSTPGGGFGGLAGAGARTDATRATEREVKETLIPALLWAMDRANRQHPDTESAAYLALAKVTDDPAHIPLLMAAVGKDGKRNQEVDQIVNESAALALGLLRRADRSRQFDEKLLDAVRDFLFQVFEDDQYPVRTRGFAMLAIGLLGDQPSARVRGADSADTAAARVYGELSRAFPDEQLHVAALLALSMQPPGDVTREMAGTLRELALRAKLFREPASDVVASYGALALGRIGTAEDARPLLDALRLRQTGVNVKRSAAIALGQIGQRVDGPARAQLAADLLRALDGVKEATARNFGLISLAHLLSADVRAERTDVLNAKGAKVADELLRIADGGKYSERTYGALALGLVGREIGEVPSILEYGQLRLKAIDVLRRGLDDQRMDKRARAAFAIALGLLRDDGRVRDLVALVADRAEDGELRGYAAVALGMIGAAGQEALRAVKGAMAERSSEELRQQAAVALGLLGSSESVPLLLKELEDAETMNVQGQIVIALAQIGDARAIAPLVRLLKDPSRPDLTRALACAGLGLIGDLEILPSLSRISKDINFRAAPDVINEVLTIL